MRGRSLKHNSPACCHLGPGGASALPFPDRDKYRTCPEKTSWAWQRNRAFKHF
jgi:hypothetical protein